MGSKQCSLRARSPGHRIAWGRALSPPPVPHSSLNTATCRLAERLLIPRIHPGPECQLVCGQSPAPLRPQDAVALSQQCVPECIPRSPYSSSWAFLGCSPASASKCMAQRELNVQVIQGEGTRPPSPTARSPGHVTGPRYTSLHHP